jgi:hypothetical protein
MPTYDAEAKSRVTSLSAVVTRADGTVVDLGVIERTCPDPFRQWWWRHVGKPLSERRIAAFNESQKGR